MLEALRSLRNQVDFRLRGTLAISRTGYREDGLPADFLQRKYGAAAGAELQDLADRWGLEAFRDKLAPMSYLDNLCHLLLLDALDWPASEPACRTVLDVGSKNFAYCPALWQFLQKKGMLAADAQLDGIEVDPHRLYPGLYTRAACSAWYTSLTGSCRYLGGDVLDLSAAQRYGLVTVFFPFIHQDSVLSWGLPAKFLRPRQLFRQVTDLLRPGGLLVVSHYTEQEYRDSPAGSGDGLELLDRKVVTHALTGNKPLISCLYRRRTRLTKP